MVVDTGWFAIVCEQCLPQRPRINKYQEIRIQLLCYTPFQIASTSLFFTFCPFLCMEHCTVYVRFIYRTTGERNSHHSFVSVHYKTRGI